jgi:hypothetical protein
LTLGTESGILDNEGVVALELKRIEGEWSNQEHLEAINPNYGTGAKALTTNCGNCTVANELRYQGYDVVALPNLIGEGLSIYELADMFDGATVRIASKLSTTDVPSEMVWKLEQDVLTWGEGARGAIRGKWLWNNDGKAGHLFSLEVRNGEVKYDDGQIGKENVKYLEDMRPQSIQYVRLDNTKPNDKVTTVVRNRET